MSWRYVDGSLGSGSVIETVASVFLDRRDRLQICINQYRHTSSGQSGKLSRILTVCILCQCIGIPSDG